MAYFDADSVRAERIKEDADYEGVRVTFNGFLGKAKIPIQVDIGFGDVVTPGPKLAEYPAMLEMPKPKLLAYPIETVIAEKVEAMVKLAIANSRMKDFHDVRTLLKDFEFKGPDLRTALENTLKRRNTALPADSKEPLAFTDAFYGDDSKRAQWNAFINKNKAYVQAEELKDVVIAMMVSRA